MFLMSGDLTGLCLYIFVAQLCAGKNVCPPKWHAFFDDVMSSQLYFVFQRGTLHDELQRRSTRKDPLTESTVLNMFLQICEAGNQ